MLKKILSGSTCAKCRLCCVFDRYDIWETPVFTDEIRDRILAEKPEAEFISKDGGYIFKAKELDENELFSCPALTETGCMLGAITIAPICDELYNRPLSQLVGLLKDGLAADIFAYANAHPEIVKPYYEGYPVLMFERCNYD